MTIRIVSEKAHEEFAKNYHNSIVPLGKYGDAVMVETDSVSRLVLTKQQAEDILADTIDRIRSND